MGGANMPFRIDSPWFRFFIPCRWKLLQFSSMLLTSIERVPPLSPSVLALMERLIRPVCRRTSFRVPPMKRKSRLFLVVYEPNSIIHCHATLPSFRWMLLHHEGIRILYNPLPKVVVRSTPQLVVRPTASPNL